MLSLAGPIPGFLDAVLRLERLVANGIGGCASGTVSGVDNPPVPRRSSRVLSPVRRALLVAKVDEAVEWRAMTALSSSA